MRILLILLMVAPAGCWRGAIFYRPTESEIAEANKSAGDRFSDQWTGMSEDDVLLRYGKPTDVVALSSGNYINSYHREVAYSAASGGGYANAYGGGSSIRSEASSYFCDRRFEIDRNTHRVVRAMIAGSRCDFRL